MTAEFLKNIKAYLDNNEFESAINCINGYISQNGNNLDERFLAEMALIESLMDAKASLSDWSYFYTMKLVYQYCEKTYLKDCKNEEIIKPLDERYKNVIWWSWLQGYDEAPEIVKVCYNSLRQLNREIIIIDSSNYTKYVLLPDYIISKWHAGIITNAHFSDILRTELLTTRGGTWIDATVFCSDSKCISEIMDNYSLFCYSFAMRDSVSNYILFDSWFLHAPRSCRILEDVKSMLYAYWANEDTLMHYFLFHIFFSIACRKNMEEYKSIPIFSLEPCHILQLEMLKPYEEKRWKQIMGMSGVHKLTYKYDQNADTSGTMLEKILLH